jgi:hypothetical protein
MPEAIRKTDLTPQNAERIVAALKTRGLIETAIVKAGPGSELFTAFLSRFWDYDESPYVRDKLAHGQSIGRRHCYDMALWLKLYRRPFFGVMMFFSSRMPKSPLSQSGRRKQCTKDKT